MYWNFFLSIQQIFSGLVDRLYAGLSGSWVRILLSFVSIFLSFKKKKLGLSWTFPAWNIIQVWDKSRKKSYLVYTAISRKVVGKMCTRQSRKVIWDMIVHCFWRLQLSNLLLLLSFSTRKHIFMAFRANSYKFLWRTVNSKPPTMPSGIVACTFSDNLCRNSCIS